MFRAAWCSFCAEQLQTFSNPAYDPWHYHDTDVIPVSSDSLGKLGEMLDRFDPRLQLLSDSDFDVTESYTEVVEHGWPDDYTRAGTFVVDTEGVVRYEHIADDAADRTYANFVRTFVKRGYEDHYRSTPGRIA